MALKIYTRTGDDGTTGLFGGERVAKDDLRIDCYGIVDELNSALGLARAHGVAASHDALLDTIQAQLFVLGADLATPRGADSEKFSIPRVTSSDVVCLERAIDTLEEALPPLKQFILPGGTPAGATVHLARTICRRAERAMVRLLREEPGVGDQPLIYINRLSDLLFVLGRAVNQQAGVQEHPWIPGTNQPG
jgi:cob(I)alamin adenosyltransferase